jgi:chorismate synthase
MERRKRREMGSRKRREMGKGKDCKSSGAGIFGGVFSGHTGTLTRAVKNNLMEEEESASCCNSSRPGHDYGGCFTK